MRTVPLSEAHKIDIGCFEDEIVILLLQTAPPLDGLVELGCELDRIKAVNPHSVGLITVVTDAIREKPSGEFLAELTRTVEARKDSLSFVALVLEGKGFLGSIMRSIVTGMSMLSKTPPYDTTICESVVEVTNWLSPKIGATRSSKLLAEVDVFKQQARVSALGGRAPG